LRGRHRSVSSACHCLLCPDMPRRLLQPYKPSRCLSSLPSRAARGHFRVVSATSAAERMRLYRKRRRRGTRRVRGQLHVSVIDYFVLERLLTIGRATIPRRSGAHCNRPMVVGATA
jgi:hypothetical protein